MRPIGYYVHHHGDGHFQRAMAIARHIPDRVVLIGTGLAGRAIDVPFVECPDDRLDSDRAFDGCDGTLQRPNALHFAPLLHEGVRARSALIAQWIAVEKPSIMVVDVSVEVALLTRLCATPSVYVRLNGNRNDEPHYEAFRAATHLLAPFHENLDAPSTPPWVRAKTTYIAGISPNATRQKPAAINLAVVVAGRGGAPFEGDVWANAARSTPEWRWRLIGPATEPTRPASNLTINGWIENPNEVIAEASVVIGAAGDGLVSTVIKLAKPFICLPESRPFDEQLQKASALEACGAAVVLYGPPANASWPLLLENAQRLNGEALSSLGNPNGAANAAAWLTEVADRQK